MRPRDVPSRGGVCGGRGGQLGTRGPPLLPIPGGSAHHVSSRPSGGSISLQGSWSSSQDPTACHSYDPVATPPGTRPQHGRGEGASGPLDPGGRWPAGTQPCAATPPSRAAWLLNGLHVPSPSHAELRTDTGQRGTWRARPAGGRLDGELVAAQTRDIPVNETDRADTSRYVRVSTANLTRLELTRHVLVTPQFKTTNTRK